MDHMCHILAPMRLLSPILEESVEQQQDLNKSLMTVISEILLNPSTTLNKTSTTCTSTYAIPGNADGHFPDSIESTSSLVHTIEEIRNNSLCNLYYATNEVKSRSSNNKAAPQVPP